MIAHRSQAKQAIVVGGGIGGLAVALALRRVGIEATVYEKAPALRELGAGITIWTNAMRGLAWLELDEQITAAGSRDERLEIRTWKGLPLASWPLGMIGRRIGFPTVGLTRPDLHGILARALGNEAVRLGMACVGFVQDEIGVAAHFADGSERRADILVGADGLMSAVRRQIHGGQAPRYAGYTTWRGIVADANGLIPDGEHSVYWGPGARLICYRVGRERPYWLAMANAPRGGEDPEDGHKAAVLARYRGWAHPIEALIEATPEAAIFRADIVGRPPLRRWGEGRVTLLGDAAHPMTPNTGQGACQAIEDAVVLAKTLADEPEATTALRAYERERIPRSSSFANASWQLGAASRWESRPACAVRDRMLSAFFGGFGRNGLERTMAHEY